jgi:hypothetical protein
MMPEDNWKKIGYEWADRLINLHVIDPANRSFVAMAIFGGICQASGCDTKQLTKLLAIREKEYETPGR